MLNCPWGIKAQGYNVCVCGGNSAPCSFLINTIASFSTAGIMNVSLPLVGPGRSALSPSVAPWASQCECSFTQCWSKRAVSTRIFLVLWGKTNKTWSPSLFISNLWANGERRHKITGQPWAYSRVEEGEKLSWSLIIPRQGLSHHPPSHRQRSKSISVVFSFCSSQCNGI